MNLRLSAVNLDALAPNVPTDHEAVREWALETFDPLVRPYSFLVWTTGEEPKLIRRLDFEHGYLDGERPAAAIGAATSTGHANYGAVDPKSDFPTVKKKVAEILGR